MTDNAFDFDALSQEMTSRTVLSRREQVVGHEIDILPGFSTTSLVDRAGTGLR